MRSRLGGIWFSAADTNPATTAFANTRPRSGDAQPYTPDLAVGFSRMITDRVRDGWSCSLVTFMFNRIPGNTQAVLSRMRDEIQRVYCKLVTRVHRKPRTAAPGCLPLFLCCGDIGAADDHLNGGLHFHALVHLPPLSRLNEPLPDHLTRHDRLYAGADTLIKRVHAVAVTHDHAYVFDYAFKAIKKGRLSYEDAVLILPRAKSEVGGALSPQALRA